MKRERLSNGHVTLCNQRNEADNFVKPHTTKAACFLLPPDGGCPLRTSECLSSIRAELSLPAAYAASAAFSLISEDKVQVLLLASSGTFVRAANHAVSGMDLSISRIKYLAPML